MLKKQIVIPLLVFTILGISGASFYFSNPKPAEVHYHAGFIVVENNQKIDFSGFKYMKIEPCGDHEHADEQLEKAHLHDSVGDVVHVHRDDPKWSDLFTNIKYPLDYSKTTAYLNGQKIESFQDQTILPFDSIVILVGENDVEKALAQTVQKPHIEEVEKKSENCGDTKK